MLADAFLEGGDVQEAGTSLMRLVDCLLYEEPARAIEALNEIVALTDRRDCVLAVCGPRRAMREPTGFCSSAGMPMLLGRCEAVALWRGLIGNEQQLISSLHLAALEARTIGKVDDAERFEGEAERLTDEIDLPHFKLVRRVVALSQNFDETEAANSCVMPSERAAGRRSAGVRVVQATRNPALTDTERLSLLEETLTYLDRLGARAVEKAPAQLALAEELRRMGEADRADEWYRKILESNPFDSDALQIFINSLWLREKWDEAIPPLERQSRLRGQLPGFLDRYARSLSDEAGKYFEPLRHWSNASNRPC